MKLYCVEPEQTYNHSVWENPELNAFIKSIVAGAELSEEGVWMHGTELVVTERELAQLVTCQLFNSGASWKLKWTRDINNNADDTLNVLTQSLDRAEVMLNKKCNRMQPNSWLNEVNEIEYRYDCCSDELQRILNDNWRILAIQPQPDQRRPDYIFGRYNKDL